MNFNHQITYHWFLFILCRLSNHMECFSEFLDFFIVSDQKTVMFLSVSFLLLGQRLKWGHQRKGFVARATCTRNSNFIIGFFWTLLATLAAFPFVIWRYLRIGDVIGEFSIDSLNPLSFSTNHSSANQKVVLRFDIINSSITANSGFFRLLVSRWREIYSFWGHLRIWSLKFQKATSKIEVFLSRDRKT